MAKRWINSADIWVDDDGRIGVAGADLVVAASKRLTVTTTSQSLATLLGAYALPANLAKLAITRNQAGSDPILCEIGSSATDASGEWRADGLAMGFSKAVADAMNLKIPAGGATTYATLWVLVPRS